MEQGSAKTLGTFRLGRCFFRSTSNCNLSRPEEYLNFHTWMIDHASRRFGVYLYFILQDYLPNSMVFYEVQAIQEVFLQL